MKKTGVADLPLHGGKCPRWLFDRMKKLADGIVKVIVYEYGQDEFITRISDPFFFQALGCTLAFDWHSSGLTTTVGGALKEALKPEEHGLAVAGGKGKVALQAQAELEKIGNIYNLGDATTAQLKYASRLAAKVDNVAVQDGHQLYHHIIIVSETGKWAVIQQGLNATTQYARRYHWLSTHVSSFVNEPHEAILGDSKLAITLDMTATASVDCQKVSVDLVCDHPNKLKNLFYSLRTATLAPSQRTIDDWLVTGKLPLSIKCHLRNETEHALLMPRTINWETLKSVYEYQPRNYEELIAFKGVGASTTRALALVSELIYGKSPSWKDPVKYSFAFGGKDGVPYPVNRKVMDKTIEILQAGVAEAKVGRQEKLDALQRLTQFVPDME